MCLDVHYCQIKTNHIYGRYKHQKISQPPHTYYCSNNQSHHRPDGQCTQRLRLMCYFCFLHGWTDSWHFVLYLYLHFYKYKIRFIPPFARFVSTNSMSPNVLMFCRSYSGSALLISPFELKISYWWIFHFSGQSLQSLWQVIDLHGELVCLSIRPPLKVLWLLGHLVICKYIQTLDLIIACGGDSLDMKTISTSLWSVISITTVYLGFMVPFSCLIR